MNKNLIVVLYFSLAGIGLLLLGAITIFSPDHIQETTGTFLQVLGLASTAAVTIYLLGSQAKDIAEVKANVNGNLTRITEQRDAAQNQLLQVVGSAPPAFQSDQN